MSYSITVTGDSLNELATKLEFAAKRFYGVPANREAEAEAPADPAPAPKSAKKGPGRPPKITPRAPDEEAQSPPAKALDKSAVQKKLIELVKTYGPEGNEKCRGLCLNHGGANLSALDPSVYQAIFDDACELIEAAADPSA